MSHLDDLIVIKYVGTTFYISPDKNKQFYTVESKAPLLTTENVPFDKIQEAVQKQCVLKAELSTTKQQNQRVVMKL